MDLLGAAAAALSAKVPLLVAFFTFKGGVGKTTLTILLATILVKLGFNVIIINGDRQRNVDTTFQENPKPPQGPRENEAEQANEEEADVSAAAKLQKKLQATGKKFMADLLQQQKEGNLCVPKMEGEPMPPDNELVPLSSDYLMPHKNEDDDLLTALNEYITSDNPRPLRLTQVQTSIYNGQDGTGKLWLLKGSKDVGKFEEVFKNGGIVKWRSVAAFLAMQLAAAKQYNADFVFTDMGPTTDIINRIFATSADLIQPCVCPESYSWSSAMSFITDVLPDWMEKWLSHKAEEEKDKVQVHRFHEKFPQVMPFMAMQYDWDATKKRIDWSDANFIKAMQLAFQELYALVNSDAAGSSSQHSSVDSCMLQAWREHLQQQMEQPSFAEMLKIIINETFVDYDRSQMVVPLLRRYKHMTECHELGVAMFDVTPQRVQEYLWGASSKGIPSNMKQKIKRMYNRVSKEGEIMQRQMESLGHTYMALLVAHNDLTPGKKGGKRGPSGGAQKKAVKKPKTVKKPQTVKKSRQ